MVGTVSRHGLTIEVHHSNKTKLVLTVTFTWELLKTIVHKQHDRVLYSDEGGCGIDVSRLKEELVWITNNGFWFVIDCLNQLYYYGTKE